jgi:hypothetical protein
LSESRLGRWPIVRTHGRTRFVNQGATLISPGFDSGDCLLKLSLDLRQLPLLLLVDKPLFLHLDLLQFSRRICDFGPFVCLKADVFGRGD